MIKIVFFVYRRPDMELEEFSRYWRETHAPIAAKIPGIRKYALNQSFSSLDGTLAPCDGLGEAWFDDLESFEQGMASPEGQAAVADHKNWMDEARMLAFSVDEVTII